MADDGGFGQSIDTLKDAVGDLASALGIEGFDGNSDLSADGAIYDDLKKVLAKGKVSEKMWTWKGSDWYKIFGYQFVVQNSLNTAERIFTLPIPPQSLNIRMIPASQVTPTIGGVVEETQENVFWLISMSGTTGIAVSRNEADKKIKRNKMAKQFRDNVGTTGLLSGALAGLNSAISKFGGTVDALVDAGSALASGDIAGGAGGLVGAINTAFLPALPYSASAVDQDTNGYTEMQEFHRFLYTYSILKSRKPSQFSLKFRSFKTNQEWNCIVQDFTIQQSASNPMLYRYNIALKCWGITQANGQGGGEFDRFKPGGDLQPVNLITPAVFTQIGTEFFNNFTP